MMQTSRTLDRILELVGRAIDRIFLKLGWVQVSVTRKASAFKVEMAVLADEIGAMAHTITKLPNGKIDIHIDYVVIKEEHQGKGIGPTCLTRQVQNAVKEGVDQISLHATGTPGQSALDGYYKWPTYGFDQELEPYQIARIHADSKAPESIKNVRHIREVVNTEAGFQWWKKNGDDLKKMIFDLTPGSYSLKLLQARQVLTLNKKRN